MMASKVNDDLIKELLLAEDDSDLDPDFIIKETDFGGSSSSEYNSDSPGESSTKDIPTGEKLVRKETKDKLPLRKKGNIDNWKRNANRNKRLRGEEYLTHKKEKMIPKKSLKIPRCRNTSTHKCSSLVPDAIRQQIFDEYYHLGSFREQQHFILHCIEEINVKRRTVANGESRRNKTRFYSFTVDQKRVKVCQKFFVDTLDINDSTIKNILIKKDNRGFLSEDTRGRHEPANKIQKEVCLAVKNHISSFPVMESHYCRRQSKKLYLEAGLSISTMHRIYKSDCERDNLVPVTYQFYSKIFKEYNLSFHIPKKDLCKKCTKYQNMEQLEKNEFKEEYETHLLQKERAREERSNDKEMAAKAEEFTAFNFDLESVLLTPKSAAGIIFYKRKLAVFNFTIYNLKDSSGNCYIWDETHGKRGANEISTCIFNYIMELPSIKQCSMMSDSCGGQNKNSIFAAMCLYLVKYHPNLEELHHKFFETGHTQMECDSIHSKIEKKSKHRDIYSTNEWETLIKLARDNPAPFHTHQYMYDDFYDFKAFSDTSAISYKIPWRKVCWLKYSKESPHLQYKTHFGEDFITAKIENKRGRPLNKVELSQAYFDRIPVSTAKYNDLMSLCKDLIIPKSYHDFYKNIPFTTMGRKETLPEPNYDESSEDE